MKKMLILVVILVLSGCNLNTFEDGTGDVSGSQMIDMGGMGAEFKIPLPAGYAWQITQSWAEHCESCEKKYPDSGYGFCGGSHMNSEYTRHAWDFNLPGNADEGKSVLSTGDGVVESVETDYNRGWGEAVVVNHGKDLCSRYAHLKPGSIRVEPGDKVCQGLKLAEIGCSGNCYGHHLHFQFENCSDRKTVARGFDDGNGVPVCAMGDDVLNANGDYNLLRLTNELRYECDNDEYDLTPLDEDGWREVECGTIPGCPLAVNCGRLYGHRFADQGVMDDKTAAAASYLWGECALDGKSDGRFHAEDKITRAEALKIPMVLYGLMGDCGNQDHFEDVDAEDWFFEVTACALKNGVIDDAAYFNPEREITFVEAAKVLVKAAEAAGVIEIKEPRLGHFPNVGKTHWAYKYVETIYAYGGAFGNMQYLFPEDKLRRGYFAVMAAALSPCYCGNVVCVGGCQCDQGNFACLSSDNSPGIGGNPPDDDNDRNDENPWNNGDNNDNDRNDDDREDRDDNNDNNDDYEDPPDDDSPLPDGRLDMELNCYIKSENNRCEGDGVVLYIKGEVHNETGRELKINDLLMSMESRHDGCEVTDPNLMVGVGVKSVEDGETKALNGHWEVTCELDASPGRLKFAFDLAEREDGEVSWTNNAVYSEVTLERSHLQQCE